MEEYPSNSERLAEAIKDPNSCCYYKPISPTTGSIGFISYIPIETEINTLKWMPKIEQPKQEYVIPTDAIEYVTPIVVESNYVISTEPFIEMPSIDVGPYMDNLINVFLYVFQLPLPSQIHISSSQSF
jgi:hypothetical protein